jgi:hypothetical protein
MTEEFYRETWFVPFRAAMLEGARSLGKFSVAMLIVSVQKRFHRGGAEDAE